MSNDDSAAVHASSDGSVAGLHPDRSQSKLPVGPATAKQLNTFQSAIFPIACFKLEDVRFDFDSSVLLPEVRFEMPVLKALIDKLSDNSTTPGAVSSSPNTTASAHPPLSIFGHTDPEGPDEYNKILGGRRAAVFYALLTRRTEIWEQLYGTKPTIIQSNGGDNWGLRSIQIMLNALPADPTVQPAPDPLIVDGKMGPATQDAVKRFQTSQNLSVDGDPGPDTRKALFLAYMNFLCVDLSNQSWQLDPQADFLGHNADPMGKGDFQGCGEYNPLMLFSKVDLQAFDAAADHTQRDLLNRKNRRVMTLLFRRGAKVTPDYWPCPRANQDSTGCKKRFWSDGDQRRQNGDVQREYAKTRDTFACRFYQRMVHKSPCEILAPMVRIRLFDPLGNPLVNAPFLAVTPQGTHKGYSNTDADAIIRDIVIPVSCTISWSNPPAAASPSQNSSSAAAANTSSPAQAEKPFPYAFDYELEVYIGIDEPDADEAARQRLSNLGYADSDDIKENVKAFQVDLGVSPTGEISDIKPQLLSQHDELCQPPMTNKLLAQQNSASSPGVTPSSTPTAAS